ncbi:hypothetical protein CF15_04150 [Pyrodictium occultum]|uniref:PIN domain-containing protein n=1 Tax=Pyrodictium occultum TaxID=2309 RepID=A0A0V8RVC1_PYROC|nr:type II toxin-antitoxin system VapC family toxin [Pyrodictium occultum]KSW11987.1 hypothetical protein CF15_04150 [Pyrodictium occultum]
MASPILVDSTVLSRLVLGESGADFAVNIFSRAEEGSDDIVIPSTAVVEALSKTAVAAAAAVTGAGLPESIEKLESSSEVRARALEAVEKLASYIARLARIGRLTVYSVNVEDIARAVELARRHELGLSEAITLAVAERLRIQKIATFSKRLRRVKGYTYMPSS